jgi:hypothetical protein
MCTRKEAESQEFHADSGRNKQVSRHDGSEQYQCSQAKEPPRGHQEESGNFHASTPPVYQNQRGVNGKPSVRLEVRPIDYFYRT